METKELLQEVNKTVAESIEKSLPEIVDASVSTKVQALETKTLGEIEDIKAELKKMQVTSKSTDK